MTTQKAAFSFARFTGIFNPKVGVELVVIGKRVESGLCKKNVSRSSQLSPSPFGRNEFQHR